LALEFVLVVVLFEFIEQKFLNAEIFPGSVTDVGAWCQICGELWSKIAGLVIRKVCYDDINIIFFRYLVILGFF
jgi:hypothetical protein